MAAAEPWELRPFEGAGPLRFGMSRDHVIELLGQPGRVLDQEPILVKVNGDVQAGYDRDGRLIALHTAGIALTWHSIALTERPASEVERDLTAAGVPYEADESGPAVPSLGLELYAPWPGQVQGVLVKSQEYDAVDSGS